MEKEEKEKMNLNTLKQIFGVNAEISISIYKMIVDEISKRNDKFFYYSVDSINLLAKQHDVGKINQCLSYEMLERIYIAALTGYLRQYRWIEGMCQGIEANNFFLFASTARAFLESSTDYYDALEDIPLSVAPHYKLIKEALSGKLDSGLMDFQEIENKLLHFQEACKSNGKEDKNLEPKSAKKYMESRNIKHLDLYDCYSYLCEITHPAKYSLDFFFDEDNYVYTININKDKRQISDFLEKYSGEYDEILERTENLCVILFRLINKFCVEKFYLHSVERININSIVLWQKVEKYIEI